jgi:catechol 2,3-dioxygenase-like lactoylglutathione lyase family enzyme
MIPSAKDVVAAVRRHVPGLSPRANPDSSLPYVGRRPVVNPVLPVSDMDEAIAFYRMVGFEVTSYDATYAWVRTCGWEFLHLSLAEVPKPGPAGAYVHVDDPDTWHVAISTASGAPEISDVVDQPWGMREFALTDPAGNVVRFGRNL